MSNKSVSLSGRDINSQTSRIRKFFGHRLQVNDLIFVLFFGILLLFLWYKLKIGISKFFDPDEYIYLHWAHDIYSGKYPYIDFFSPATPFFSYALSHIYNIWQGIQGVIAARIFAFIIFVAFSSSVAWLFWEIERSFLAILTTILLILLPIPPGKYLEIRPDPLMSLFMVLGITFFIKWLKNRTNLPIFFSGFFLMLSLLTYQKTLPEVSIVCLFALIYGKPKEFFSSLLHGKKNVHEKKFYHFGIFWMAVGLVVPLAIFFWWIKIFQNFEIVLYSIVKLPFEFEKRAPGYFTTPWSFYFSPNDIYYGRYGYTLGYLTNLSIWIAGIASGIGIFIWANIKWRGLKTVAYQLIGLVFMIKAVLYLYVLPYQFTQYLIPLSAFLVIFLVKILQETGKWITPALSLIFYLGIGALLLLAFIDIYKPMLSWTNQAGQIQQMEYIFNTVPKKSSVLDLQGNTIYYSNPFYVCCEPYAEFKNFLSLKLPSLSQVLQTTKTRYINQSGVSLEAIPSEDKEFIEKHYQPTGQGHLYVTNDW